MKKMETEKALSEFVIQMEDTLQKHSGEKGDSWNDCDMQFLIDKLEEEIKEYRDETKPLAKAEELVDVANMCMMLYHRYMDIWVDKVSEFVKTQ